jgi:hypothetical protein
MVVGVWRDGGGFLVGALCIKHHLKLLNDEKRHVLSLTHLDLRTEQTLPQTKLVWTYVQGSQIWVNENTDCQIQILIVQAQLYRVIEALSYCKHVL